MNSDTTELVKGAATTSAAEQALSHMLRVPVLLVCNV